MNRVFLGNFDFEHELKDVGGGSPARSAAGDELCWAWLAIAEPGDCVLCHGGVDLSDLADLERLGLAMPRFVKMSFRPGAIEQFELVPWGWTESAKALAEVCGWRAAAPPLEAVAEANSREFRFTLECEWQLGLLGAELATSLEELAAAVAISGRRDLGWLLKANYGMSGREAIRGFETTLDERTRNWAAKRLRYGPIVVEPIVERIAEAGIQIEMPSVGPPRLAGVTPLIVDRSGVYRGSRFGELGSETEIWGPAVEVALRAARRAGQRGYFGPFGVDVMRYRDDSGSIRLRPLQDLNARYTMGRLALGFARILQPGWCGIWVHFGSRHLAGRDLAALLSSLAGQSGAMAMPASPGTIGGREANHRAALLLAPSLEVLRRAEEAVFGALAIDL